MPTVELSSIYKTAPIGLAVLDTNLRFVQINERLAAINGLPVEAHIGRSVAEILPSLASQAEGVLRNILQTGEPLRDVEIRGQAPSMPGVERVFIEQFTPLRDASGKIVAISVVAEEVTDRRRLEQEVRTAQERLKLALDAARLVMWEWRLDTDEVVISLGDWTGVPLEQPLKRQRLRGLIHPDDRQRLDGCIDDHVSGRTGSYECEYRIRGAGGDYRWALSKGRITQWSASGEPLVMTGLRQDITAQREATERLAASERDLLMYRERLEVALDAGRMGVWEWIPGRDTACWSRQIFEFAQLPPTPDGVADTRHFDEGIADEDRPALDAQLAKVLDQGGDFEAEFRFRAAGGPTRWLLTRGRVLHDAGSGASRLIGVVLDISEHKALEHSLRESDARRNEFLAMLGHELRNPLAPITNAVRLLERYGSLDQKQASAVQIVKRQSQHMARLVDDLLEVSRITQGRIELRVENLLVATAVYAAVETARPLARQKRQHLELAVAPDLEIVADHARLVQVLSNLIVNAVKYTPPGGHIRITAGQGGGGMVELQVADDGMGISHDLVPRVFELFTQDHRTLDRSEGGLGLGLALVKRLVELHGGHVSCESAGPGKGSVFTVCLPAQGRREELRVNQAHAQPARIAPTTILVVDDNRDAAETMATLLRLDGHRIHLAFDGPGALEIARQEAPQVVLLDIGLPGMDGLEVARGMRAMPRMAHARIIGMSGYAQSGDRAASVSAGLDAHLAKPAQLAEVYRVIETLQR